MGLKERAGWIGDRLPSRSTPGGHAPRSASSSIDLIIAKIEPSLGRATNTELGRTTTMLFCLTADYTPQALNAMRENPNTNRQAAVEQLLSAAGGKLVAMYGRATNGPGAMVIFDVADPAMAAAITGVAVSAGTIQNVEMTRLFTMEEVAGLREKARQIRGAYKPPGQQ